MTHQYQLGDYVRIHDHDGAEITVKITDSGIPNRQGDFAFKAGARMFKNSEILGLGEVPVTLAKDLEEQWALMTPAPDTEVHADLEREQSSISSTGGAKNVKPEKFSLIPVEALAKVAEHYGVGAKKYSAHQWRKGYEWSKSYDALQRHATAFWSGEDNDFETGTPHMAAVAFHALTLLTFMDEQPAHDDRYRSETK